MEIAPTVDIAELKTWETFKSNVHQAMQSMPYDQLCKGWESKTNRTRLYFDELFPQVASAMGYEYGKEKLFRIDGVFYRRGPSGYLVPHVFIESENDADSAGDEVYKLCCLNAPLKILFICQEWTLDRKTELTQDEWNYIINDFVKENHLIGILGIVVAEWDTEFKLHTFAYNAKGNLFDSEPLVIVLPELRD